MAVIHTPRGYTGQVDQIAEAQRFALAAPPFRVASVNDWQPTVSGSVNRTINLASGSAVAVGVLDTTGSADSIALGPNVGGSDRYDAVVATWDWIAMTVTFGVIPGTTVPPLVNPSSTTAQAGQINRIPGVKYDALIAVVRVRAGVGLFTSGDLYDSRMWAGYEGYACTGHHGYLTLLDTKPGSLVLSVNNNIVWNRLIGNTWGVEKWVGTDRAEQPMYALRNSALSVVQSYNRLVTTWPDKVDHGLGLLTYDNAGHIKCNYQGQVRIDAWGLSDSTADGQSTVTIGFPAGGGSYLSALEDRRPRLAGFAGGGTIRQPLSAGPLVVAPNDLIGLSIDQVNDQSYTLSYYIVLQVTYV